MTKLKAHGRRVRKTRNAKAGKDSEKEKQTSYGTTAITRGKTSRTANKSLAPET